jgi:hypothetical protein
MVRTPASPSAFRGHLEMTAGNWALPCTEVAQVARRQPCNRVGVWPGVVSVMSGKRLQQGLGFLEVGGIKPFDEPVVNRCDQLVSFVPPALRMPQLAQAHAPSPFEPFGPLAASKPCRGRARSGPRTGLHTPPGQCALMLPGVYLCANRSTTPNRMGTAIQPPSPPATYLILSF